MQAAIRGGPGVLVGVGVVGGWVGGDGGGWGGEGGDRWDTHAPEAGSDARLQPKYKKNTSQS